MERLDGEKRSASLSHADVSLPDEVYQAIFEHLTPVELSRIACTGHRLRRIVHSSSLWESAYLAFWREEDYRQAERRQTIRWREGRRIASLRQEAERAWLRQRKQLNDDRNDPSMQSCPFPVFLSAATDTPHHLSRSYMPSFFDLFVERIAIDQIVLDELQEQCQLCSGWIERIDRLVTQYGNDMKDVLHALVCVQQRTPPPNALDVSMHDFPTAFQLRLSTAQRSPTFHLTLLHLGRELLEHIQSREAMRGLLAMRPDCQVLRNPNSWCALCPTAQEGSMTKSERRVALAQEAKQFENGLCWLSMFRGGEGQEVSEELDVLAIACSLYLARCVPTYKSGAIQFATGICQFMQSRGFRGASDGDFHNLDNNFIHLCIDESARESLPLTLVVIFCSIAARLGLHAFPTTTPMKIMAVVDDDDTQTGNGERFWVNVYNDGQILRRGETLGLFGTRISFTDDAVMGQSTPAACCLRAARNIITSVQRAQVQPTFHTAPLDKLVEDDEEGVEGDEVSSRWARDASLQPDEWFNRSALAPDATFNPRRTFLHPKHRSIYLVSPFWAADVSGVTLRRTRTSYSTTTPTPFLATAGRFQRVSHWPEATQHAAMHAASNALTRLGDELGERGVEWSMGLVRTFFPLDILVMHDELTGDVRASEATNKDARVRTPMYIRDERRRESVTQTYNALLSDDRRGPVPKKRVRQEIVDGETVTRCVANAPSGDPIHRVGTIFLHRVYRYRAVVVGWDERCEAAEDWIINMGVDALPNGGRRQPFYQTMVEDGSTRYVAHCNVQTARLATQWEQRRVSAVRSINVGFDGSVLTSDEVERIMQIRGVGRMLRCVAKVDDDDAQRSLLLLRNGLGDAAFPDG